MVEEIKLVGIMEKLNQQFKLLLQLSRQQLEVIEKEAYELIAPIAGERLEIQKKIEMLISDLEKSEQELLESKNTEAFSPGRIINAGYIEQKTEIRDIISLIQLNDSKSQALLSEGMRKARLGLQNARGNKKAVQQYYPEAVYEEAWFFDKRK